MRIGGLEKCFDGTTLFLCTFFFYSDTAFARFLETGERLHSFSETGKTPRESFLVNLSRCWRARFDLSHFSKLRCTTFPHHSSRQDAIGDRKVSDPLALSLTKPSNSSTRTDLRVTHWGGHILMLTPDHATVRSRTRTPV